MRITFFIDLICQNQLFDCWLTDKVAIVTGGNGGIGLGMARGLAQAGAELMIVGRDQKKSSAAVKELAAIGVKAAPGAADLTDEAARRSVVARTVVKFGRLDILVNNAGIGIANPPDGPSPRRGPNAPFAELVRLSRTSIADEMPEEHRRRVLGK